MADHSYRAAVLALVLPSRSDAVPNELSSTSSQTPLNRDRCVKMALVHDLAESLVGDISPDCGVSKDEKHRRERVSFFEFFYT